MPERMTNAQIYERSANLNRRLKTSGRHVQAEQRNGYWALDEYKGTACVRTITAGTKREVADFLHAMMVGIDLSQVRP